MKPIIKYNDKLLKNLSWFMSIGGITLFPYIILKEKYRDRAHDIINHESIHIKQQGEMLIIPFYIFYVLEFVLKLFIYGNLRDSYMNISFEREAYLNETDRDYLENRKSWSWIKYL
jgi:hypothetical protein